MAPADPVAPVDDDLDVLLGVATEIARDAGMLALEGRRGSIGELDNKSSPTDLVTQYDRNAEALIVERLAESRPHDSVIGEEGTEIIGTSRYTWSIDPIDGTTNYVYDLPAWCTSVAVLLDGRAVAGAVYVPVTDELYAAADGRGATLNGRTINCSDRDDLSLALIATGFAYQPALRRTQAERIARMITSLRDIRRLGSAALDLCHVAVGRVDGYFEEYLNQWDAAAGELIAREAGAISSDFAGNDPEPGQLVVAGPGIHAALVTLIGDLSAV